MTLNKTLEGLKAKDIMKSPVVTVSVEDTMRRASALMMDHRISGMPVLDLLERPVGTLSKTDVARYERERTLVPEPRMTSAGRSLETNEPVEAGKGFIEEGEEDLVPNWMTPSVYAVEPDTSLVEVLDRMIKKHVHRLFVKDEAKKEITGVITTFDILHTVQEGLHQKGKKNAKAAMGLR